MIVISKLKFIAEVLKSFISLLGLCYHWVQQILTWAQYKSNIRYWDEIPSTITPDKCLDKDFDNYSSSSFEDMLAFYPTTYLTPTAKCEINNEGWERNKCFLSYIHIDLFRSHLSIYLYITEHILSYNQEERVIQKTTFYWNNHLW